MQKRVETARRVLGIDPGYDRCGVAVVERREHKETLLYSNCIIPEKGELGTRFLELGTRIEALITVWRSPAKKFFLPAIKKQELPLLNCAASSATSLHSMGSSSASTLHRRLSAP